MSFAQLNLAADFVPVSVKQTYDAEASPNHNIVLFFDYSGIPRWFLIDELREIDLADLVAAGLLTGPPVPSWRSASATRGGSRSRGVSRRALRKR